MSKFSTILHHIDPKAPRWDFVDGAWVKRDPSKAVAANPEYVRSPYEEIKWTPEEGFTLLASNGGQSTIAITEG